MRGGGDTDTVAAIAGSLAGAVHGGSAVPARLEAAAARLARHRRERADSARLPRRPPRPDPTARGGRSPSARRSIRTATTSSGIRTTSGVWIGSIAALDRLPAGVDAVVSLCRVGTRQVPDGLESVQVWLIDQPDRNDNLDFVLTEAADVVAALRAEGKTVFLHCAEGRSRTSTVAALYGARHRGVPSRAGVARRACDAPEVRARSGSCGTRSHGSCRR